MSASQKCISFGNTEVLADTKLFWVTKLSFHSSLCFFWLKGRQTVGVAMCANDAKLERLVANWKLRRCAISHKNEEDFHFIRSFVVVKKKIFRNVTSLFEDILHQIEKKQNWNILHTMFFPYRQRASLLVHCKVAIPFVSQLQYHTNRNGPKIA